MISSKATLIAASVFLILSGCNESTKIVAASKDEALPILAAPAGADWTETTVKTAEGGMLMGNPAAPVKLIEYGALSCSHCAHFAETSRIGLKAMIATGRVSYEFRNFLLNVIDVPAALLARCGGSGPFFPISEQLFATQADWLGKMSTVTPAEQASWAKLTPEQLAPQLAIKLGLDQFVQARGIGAEKAKACVSSKAGIDELGQMSKVAQEKFKVTATPTFIINGLVVSGVGDWDMLAPELKRAGA